MTRHPYPPVESNPDFPKMEEAMLRTWKQEQTFLQSVENRPAENKFVFYDGPPFANGLPHYGHLLTGFVKDIVARYQTMQGKRVERRFGWDCHGLPAEMGAEKELGISGRIQITEFGIDKFNDHCRSSVMRYTNEWEDYVTRQARWVDFEHSYKTMDTSYMESVMWAFKQLYAKGLVYESMRVMPYSWACETPLSNFETRMDNAYRKKESKAVTVAFSLKEKPKAAPEGCTAYKILAWTTTPWTLPSNLAVAVGKDIAYAAIVKDGVCYITSESSLKNYEKELGAEISAVFGGSDLIGLTYAPLFPYFKNTENAFRILSGEFVTDTDGTGTVHLAPGFGEDDFALCVENEIPVICPVDNAGKFTAEMHELHYGDSSLHLAHRQVFDTNDDIIKYLKAEGAWIRTEQYIHDYPHCWRTDTPLIYKAVPSWYVEVTKFRDRMVELNQEINWIPGNVKDGLFGKWLENARDWSISRNRFWGSPIPVWKSDNPANKNLYVFGSIKELEAFFGVEVKDLHKPFIDELTKPDPENPAFTLRRVPDVFDCWFESGSMPYAQIHYMGEGAEPPVADFIVEYTAQTRGWFYTLMVLSTALFDKIPFKNCICHGVILDEKGQKLSKRLNNYADPKEIFAEYGADALRWLMVSSPVMRGQELLIDKEGKMVRDVLRLSIKPIWNAYHFFTLYANSDGVRAKFNTEFTHFHLMDFYITVKANETIAKVAQAMDGYDTPSACAAIESFFEVLNNWYIRRSRPRFWKTEKDADKQAAYDTLYTVLHIMCRLAAPLLPLVTETIYRALTGEQRSVHLADFPEPIWNIEESALLASMDKVRDACNAALSIRNSQNIRIRQPLASLTLVGAFSLNDELKELIADEVNVKHVITTDESAIKDHAEYKLQINFPVLGKRLPEKMKQIIPAAKKGEWTRLADGQVEILGEVLTKEECSLSLDPKDKTAAAPLSSNDALVILDIILSPELKAEGIARDVVRAIQQARKDADLNVSDRIRLVLDASPMIVAACQTHEPYIAEQTLASSLTISKTTAENYVNESEIEGEKVRIGFSVA